MLWMSASLPFLRASIAYPSLGEADHPGTIGIHAVAEVEILTICATILLSNGVHAKFVQKLLGHSTTAITLDTYSHVLPGMGGGTAAAMDEALP